MGQESKICSIMVHGKMALSLAEGFLSEKIRGWGLGIAISGTASMHMGDSESQL